MDDFIVLDIETTGINPDTDYITELGGVKIINGEVAETFSRLINPGIHIPFNITQLTGIDDETVKDMPPVQEVLRDFIVFCGELPIMGHNIMFDYSFIKTHAQRHRMEFEKCGVDTLDIARLFLKELQSRSLTNLCQHFQIVRHKAHRAYDDAAATYNLYRLLKEKYMDDDHTSVFEPKPLHYKPVKQQPCTPKQQKFLSDLAMKNNISLAKPVGEFTKSEASREIDRIISQNGR